MLLLVTVLSFSIASLFEGMYKDCEELKEKYPQSTNQNKESFLEPENSRLVKF